jgi:DNA-binding MarR family transcriptional regulator
VVDPATTSSRAGPGGSPLDLAELVSRAARRLRRGSAAHLAPLGLTMAQARVLKVVADGPLRMADIAARLEVVPRTVTPMVDDLAEAGLVERREDAADRRSVLVEPTRQGRAVLGRLDQARRATAEQVFGALDAEGRAELAELLGRCCGDCARPEARHPHHRTHSGT